MTGYNVWENRRKKIEKRGRYCLKGVRLKVKCGTWCPSPGYTMCMGACTWNTHGHMGIHTHTQWLNPTNCYRQTWLRTRPIKPIEVRAGTPHRSVVCSPGQWWVWERNSWLMGIKECHCGKGVCCSARKLSKEEPVGSRSRTREVWSLHGLTKCFCSVCKHVLITCIVP